MTASLTPVKWNVDDYHRMIDAGILMNRRAELLWGEIVAMAPEGKPHAHLSSNGADYIREQLAGSVKVREEKPITLGNASEPEPDIAISQGLGDVYLEHHPFAENVFWLEEYADASYQSQQTLTEGWVSPVMFLQISLAVNRFIRR
ncbi:MAG: Uma2 family endonuclease [Leptolyngbya sp. RL_3_1]|nr:Uma2 family endonuclease [Leptolyngbya sp. RL_3_1]